MPAYAERIAFIGAEYAPEQRAVFMSVPIRGSSIPMAISIIPPFMAMARNIDFLVLFSGVIYVLVYYLLFDNIYVF